jgi:hypothetical protein
VSNHLSKEQRKLIGTLLLNEFFEVALMRQSGSRPFNLYVDEAAEFVTPEMGEALETCRQKGLDLNLSFQHLSQFREPGNDRLYKAIKNNARNKLVFAMPDRQDAMELSDDLFVGMAEPEIKYLHRQISYMIEDVRQTSTTRSTGSSRGSGQSQNSSTATASSAGTSSGRNESEQNSDQEGRTQARSHQQGRNWQQATGKSRTQSDGSAHSRGYADSYGESDSDSESLTNSASQQKSDTKSSGLTITVSTTDDRKAKPPPLAAAADRPTRKAPPIPRRSPIPIPCRIRFRTASP